MSSSQTPATMSSSSKVLVPIQQKVNQFMNYGPVKRFFDEAEKRTGKPRMTLIEWGCLPFIVLFGSTVVRLICCLLATLYPAYSCLKAIVNKDESEQQRWREYWIVISLLYVTDLFFSPLISTVVPFFWLIKFAVLVWCVASGNYNGSKIIFNKAISPLYLKFGKQIDDFVCKISEAFVMGAAEVIPAVIEVMEDVKEVADDVLEEIEEAGETVEDEVTNVVADVMEEVEEVAENLLEDVKDIGSKIARNNIVGGFASLVEQVGKSID